MVNRRLLLLFFISGLACLSFIFTIIVQAQSGDSPPPDRPADVSEESSATDWSQIVLPAHEESAPVVKPAPDSAENLTAVPPMTTNPTTYTIQVGDTLFSIARRFGVSMAALEAANQIVNPNRFYVGQILRIPTENQAVPPPIITNSQPTQSVTYTVQRGDALSAIAQQYGVDMAVLAAVNSIANPSFIRVGQILNIPGPAAALPPTNPEPTPAPIETPPVDRTIETRRGYSPLQRGRGIGAIW